MIWYDMCIKYIKNKLKYMKMMLNDTMRYQLCYHVFADHFELVRRHLPERTRKFGALAQHNSRGWHFMSGYSYITKHMYYYIIICIYIIYNYILYTRTCLRIFTPTWWFLRVGLPMAALTTRGGSMTTSRNPHKHSAAEFHMDKTWPTDRDFMTQRRYKYCH